VSTDERPANIYIDKQTPAAYRALNGLALKVGEAAEAAGLDRKLVELLNLRISQINGCAYCLNMHTRLALGEGETAQRLSVLPSWRDTEVFTDKERAALALAEALTELPAHHSQEREYAAAREQLTDEEFSAVSWITVAMNAFNRVSIVSKHRVRPSK
jgi:AhpD family alkylhydroperoxidase